MTQDKLLYFRDSNRREVFYPLSRLKGIKNDFSNTGIVEFWFSSMKHAGQTKHAYETAGVDGDDFVRIKFNNNSFVYGAILYFWQRVYTAKTVIFKVVDAVDDGNGHFTFAAFGPTYNQYLIGHATNAAATEPDLADACVINLQLES
tara:strand:+ start:7826 stop:8266 length:441 start_codon:yes stop_codon:yes gene_type:complete